MGIPGGMIAVALGFIIALYFAEKNNVKSSNFTNVRSIINSLTNCESYEHYGIFPVGEFARFSFAIRYIYKVREDAFVTYGFQMKKQTFKDWFFMKIRHILSVLHVCTTVPYAKEVNRKTLNKNMFAVVNCMILIILD